MGLEEWNSRDQSGVRGERLRTNGNGFWCDIEEFFIGSQHASSRTGAQTGFLRQLPLKREYTGIGTPTKRGSFLRQSFIL